MATSEATDGLTPRVLDSEENKDSSRMGESTLKTESSKKVEVTNEDDEADRSRGRISNTSRSSSSYSRSNMVSDNQIDVEPLDNSRKVDRMNLFNDGVDPYATPRSMPYDS